MKRTFALTFCLAAIACGDGTAEKPLGPPGLVVTALSRSAAPEPAVRSVPSLGSNPDEVARKQILAHVPKGPDEITDAGTLLGTNTDEPIPDAGTTSTTANAAKPVETHVSMVATRERSAPAIEKLLRATVYFQLVNRCRDDAHSILPPEAIVLGFEVDGGGAIIDGTIHAEAKNPKHEAAAECMIRELAASSFRAPPATRGESTTVTMPVPSVD